MPLERGGEWKEGGRTEKTSRLRTPPKTEGVEPDGEVERGVWGALRVVRPNAESLSLEEIRKRESKKIMTKQTGKGDRTRNRQRNIATELELDGFSRKNT